MNELIRQLKLPEEKNTSKKFMRGAEPFFDSRNPEVGILLLHGFTATPYQFKEFRQFLEKKNLTAYAPTLAGHGTHPDELGATTIADWMESAEKAYDELKAKVKKIVIIGNSFGGNLAFQLSLRNDNALKGIVSLGSPVFMRFQKFILLRIYTYGWFKKNYRKHGRNYRELYTEVQEIVSYPVIPLNSLRDFFRFLKYFTIPNLRHVKTPTLIIQSNADPIVHPKSVQYLHEFLGSEYKKVCWFNDEFHSLHEGTKKQEIFEIIYSFIQEVANSKK